MAVDDKSEDTSVSRHSGGGHTELIMHILRVLISLSMCGWCLRDLATRSLWEVVYLYGRKSH